MGTDLAWLLIWTILLKNEVTEVLYHVIEEVALDADFIGFTFWVMSIILLIDLLLTVNHEAVEDIKEAVELAPVPWCPILQKLCHLHDEPDALSLGFVHVVLNFLAILTCE